MCIRTGRSTLATFGVGLGLLMTTLAACSGNPGDPGTKDGGGTTTPADLSGTDGGPAISTVPTTPMELFAYLKAGSYLGLPVESGIHTSTGPHGSKVRTYVSPSLLASLQAGNAEHPKGSATIKELYLNGTTVQGWAVMVKTQDTSNGGQGWYWYETFNATDPTKFSTSGNGVALCYNCHSTGKDYFRTPFPLQ